ncbi:hypothetical protein EYF80_010901 [Liparis tanakae]|uniref:Uncharacterized protein n=1 Tax=Liparis tanakae TaxID=230148 RepID=A0A4Z2ILR3_9TELE|nr:hypothetical protein EYF80_010901 [Liparis tanakae]
MGGGLRDMRLLLTIVLILLFLWLRKAQTSVDVLHGNPCEAVSSSRAAAWLLLTPLSLYSWLASTLLRLVLAVPALVLSSLHHSLLLLLLVGPWCVASVCASLWLTCLRVAVYLLHLALVVGVVAGILILAQRKMADGDSASERVLYRERWRPQTRLGMFGSGDVQRG